MHLASSKTGTPNKTLQIPGKWLVAITATVVLALGGMVGIAETGQFSLRFEGNAWSAPDLDRVKIVLDDPHRPIDVGSGDFTVEWWMKASAEDNNEGQCFEASYNWIFGNIFLDRDIDGVFYSGGDWGVSILGGVIAFGVASSSSGAGICGSTAVGDLQWHHVAVTRDGSSGGLRIFVDGTLEREVSTGATGDVSYPDGRVGQSENDPFLVIGAEKHNYAVPAYTGWFDELRVSTIVRYDADFDAPSWPFKTDEFTAALYHFDEGEGHVALDLSGAPGGPSNGEVKIGGNPLGPTWSTDTPFAVFSDGFESGSAISWSSVVN